MTRRLTEEEKAERREARRQEREARERHARSFEEACRRSGERETARIEWRTTHPILERLVSIRDALGPVFVWLVCIPISIGALWGLAYLIALPVLGIGYTYWLLDRWTGGGFTIFRDMLGDIALLAAASFGVAWAWKAWKKSRAAWLFDEFVLILKIVLARRIEW